MANSVISDGFDNIYGFYRDLKAFMLEQIKTELEGGNYEGVLNEDQAGALIELDKLEDYDGIIAIMNNNGMGLTVEKYQYKEN